MQVFLILIPFSNDALVKGSTLPLWFLPKMLPAALCTFLFSAGHLKLKAGACRKAGRILYPLSVEDYA